MVDRTIKTITRTVTLSDLTPVELASIFAAYDDGQQAAFFNALAAETGDWPGTGWEGQCYHICKNLSPDGQRIVADLADNYISSIT